MSLFHGVGVLSGRALCRTKIATQGVTRSGSALRPRGPLSSYRTLISQNPSSLKRKLSRSWSKVCALVRDNGLLTGSTISRRIDGRNVEDRIVRIQFVPKFIGLDSHIPLFSRSPIRLLPGVFAECRCCKPLGTGGGLRYPTELLDRTEDYDNRTLTAVDAQSLLELISEAKSRSDALILITLQAF